MGVIRLILAISVVIAHSNAIFGFELVGGKVAVQAFYIISGFYMTLILNEKYPKGSYKLFISSRLLRLFPIYWIVLFLTLLYSIVIVLNTKGLILVNFDPYVKNWENLNFLTICYLFFTNIFLLFQDFVMFLGVDLSNGSLFFTSNFMETSPRLSEFLFIPQAWTVGVEIQFYLLAPFLVRRKTYFIVILIFCSLILRIFLIHKGLNHDPWTYRFFPTELVFFLLGFISYKIYLKIRNLNIPKQYHLVFLSLILCSILFFDKINFQHKEIAFFLLFVLSVSFIFYLSKNWRIDSYIGEWSYPVYISHIFIIKVLMALKVPTPGIIVTIFSILFAFIINEIVSKRIEKYRQKRIVNYVTK